MELIPVSHAPGRPEGPTAVALGFFDGVHAGHAALLSATVARAEELGVTPAVFTFSSAGGVKGGASRIDPDGRRLSHIADRGIARAYVADFADLRDLSPEEFVDRVLIGRCAARAVICGFNFRFGRGAAGTPETLRDALATHGVPLTVLPAVEIDRKTVSTSAIRAALEAGDAEGASRMLGRPFSLTGEVLHGKALGRTIGCPTVNQVFAPGLVTPANGVYAVVGQVGDALRPTAAAFGGVANVGVRPTVETDGALNCETHFFADVGDLYGKTVTVFFLRRLRGEQKFADVSALQEQIARDAENAKEYITKWKTNGSN